METPKHAIFLFLSVSHVLKAEKILKAAGIANQVIPVPRDISTDCGVCLRVEAERKDAVTDALRGGVPWERTVLL